MTEHLVRSPLPGVFYRRPAPGQPVFAETGQAVTAGQTIGLVEVMKQFSQVAAGTDGTLSGFSVEDEATVGPGDVLATIDAG